MAIAAYPLDLPLNTSSSGRSLSWVVAVLVYWGLVFLALAALSHAVIKFYQRQPVLMTVALPPAPATIETTQANAKITQLLRDVDGVVFVNAVELDKHAEPFGPWVNSQDVKLAVPRFIDIGFSPRADIDFLGIDAKLKELTPGLALGERHVAGSAILPTALAFRSVLLATGVICLFAAVPSLMLTIGLAFKRQTRNIGLLRQFGANRTYIARQFEHYALIQSLKGGVLGTLFAIATVLVAIAIANLVVGERPIDFELSLLEWIAFSLVPVCLALLAAPMTRLAVSWRLSDQ